MVLDPIPQSLPVHFFGSRPQPPTSPFVRQKRLSQKRLTCRPMWMISTKSLCIFIYLYLSLFIFIYEWYPWNLYSSYVNDMNESWHIMNSLLILYMWGAMTHSYHSHRSICRSLFYHSRRSIWRSLLLHDQSTEKRPTCRPVWMKHLNQMISITWHTRKRPTNTRKRPTNTRKSLSGGCQSEEITHMTNTARFQINETQNGRRESQVSFWYM